MRWFIKNSQSSTFNNNRKINCLWLIEIYYEQLQHNDFPVGGSKPIFSIFILIPKLKI